MKHNLYFLQKIFGPLPCAMVIYIFVTFGGGCSKVTPSENLFRLHIFQQPQSLDSTLSRSSSGSYFFHNLMRGLYRFDESKGLVPEGGECQWVQPKHLRCSLFESHKWSDGTRVSSAHYIQALQALVDPITGSPRAYLLQSVGNASQILAGLKNKDQLQIISTGPFNFDIQLDQPDSDFLLKLTSTALLPKHPNNLKALESYKTFLTTGPYRIKDWKFGQWIDLEKNTSYKKGHPQRPNIRFYIVGRDLTAFRLYEKRELDFLRRVVVSQIPQVQHRPDFFQKPMARFDYIGFGPRLRPLKHLRKALALGINYSKSAVLLHALGPLGCSSLPTGWASSEPCHIFSQTKAREALSKTAPPKNLTYAFSRLGGDDLALQSQWIQHQWKVHLKLQIELSPTEQGAYLQQLRHSPPDIFRKGVGLDFPSCLAALQTFASHGPQNYIQFQNATYKDILKTMNSTTNKKNRRDLCHKGLQILIGGFHIIPMGKMHFSMLASPKFVGWKLNTLNQLDLGQLHPIKR